MLFHYFCYIIPFNIKLVNVGIFQIYKVRHSSEIMLLFLIIFKLNIYLVNKSVFQILDFHHTAAINNM
jgi:hypothetical protein